MVRRFIAVKALAAVISLLMVVVTAPFSLAETVAAAPLGAVVTAGSVTVGDAAAPTGTTIFAGDRVASDGPALIALNGGSRIEMTKAAATFSRQGGTLTVQANQGLLRFNFVKGENVRIKAGKYTFTSTNDSAHVGELGLTRDGEIAMNVTEGSFAALDTSTGTTSEASLGNPVVAANPGDGSQKGAATAGAGAKAGLSTAAKVAIILGIAGGAGLGIGIYMATKSP